MVNVTGKFKEVILVNVKEALTVLEEHRITSSKQMLLRWIRQGKIEATLPSKKEGYMIDVASLESFIKNKHKDNPQPVQAGFQDGYKEGYNAALLDLSERFKKMAFLGMYEVQYPIYRSEFRDICARRISKARLKDFLVFSDKEFFAKQVTSPRKMVWCNAIGNYFYFELVHILIDQEKYEIDPELAPEYHAYDLLIQELLIRLIEQDKITSNMKG